MQCALCSIALLCTVASRVHSIMQGRATHLNDLTLDPFPTGACWSMSCSSLAGEGMNPISQFSFTFLPIHQLPSYFSNMCRNSPILKLKQKSELED